MPKCEFFRIVESERIIDRQKRATASIYYLTIPSFNYCAHPTDSALRKDEKGELECNGNIGTISNCPLKK